jgi:hypothetical protein
MDTHMMELIANLALKPVIIVWLEPVTLQPTLVQINAKIVKLR